jgi:hypothetical protein
MSRKKIIKKKRFSIFPLYRITCLDAGTHCCCSLQGINKKKKERKAYAGPTTWTGNPVF